MQIPEGDLDLVAVGETLIDFISTDEVDHLSEAETFRRYLGGSPANIAVNVARLGGRSAVVSKVGGVAFSQFARDELRRYGVCTDYIVTDPEARTSMVFVTRSKRTPDFEDFRDADFRLAPAELAPAAIARARVVHASSFAASREPCRSTIRRAFSLAHDAGKLISFDPNYSPRIWPDKDDALATLRELYRYTTLTKPSLDDAMRLMGPGLAPEEYIGRFHDMGVRLVILTMGREGILMSDAGKLLGHVPARSINVVDATGAGDSFWAGFLVALLDGNSIERSVLFAREVVETKLANVGPLPAWVSREAIYQRLPIPAS